MVFSFLYFKINKSLGLISIQKERHGRFICQTWWSYYMVIITLFQFVAKCRRFTAFKFVKLAQLVQRCEWSEPIDPYQLLLLSGVS